MKVIIAGSRTIKEYNIMRQGINNALLRWKINDIKEVVSGHCPIGVDVLGEEFATIFHIPIKLFPANWGKYGKKAGYLRNIEMANYADALIAIWDGVSKGTKHMIDISAEKNLKTYVYNLKELK